MKRSEGRRPAIAASIVFMLLVTPLSWTAASARARGLRDTSFGGARGGIVAVKARAHEFGHTIQLLDGGRVLLAGPSTAEYDGVSEHVAMSVLGLDGRLDNSFGVRGTKTISVNGDGYGTPVVAAPA